MRQNEAVCGSGPRGEHSGAWEPRVHVAHRSNASRETFNRRLDAVVLRALERTPQHAAGQSADEDYAMRWAIARYLRSQSRPVKGEHHGVAA
jgi:hypothetical protein